MKPFDVTDRWSGHDLTKFTGRLAHFWEIVSPEKGLYLNSDIVAYQKKVD